MTRRERAENRIARRLEWAEKRKAKAAPVARLSEQYRGDHAFNTQPGHIPERARLIRAEDRAYKDLQMAEHHESKAAGIAAQLDRTIFTDDHDAPQVLRSRIADLENQQARMKAINAILRKGAGWGARLDAAGLTLTDKEKGDLESVARFQPYYCKNGAPIFPPYALSNLSGNIRRLKGRLTAVDALAEQRAKIKDALDSDAYDEMGA